MLGKLCFSRSDGRPCHRRCHAAVFVDVEPFLFMILLCIIILGNKLLCSRFRHLRFFVLTVRLYGIEQSLDLIASIRIPKDAVYPVSHLHCVLHTL